MKYVDALAKPNTVPPHVLPVAVPNAHTDIEEHNKFDEEPFTTDNDVTFVNDTDDTGTNGADGIDIFKDNVTNISPPLDNDVNAEGNTNVSLHNDKPPLTTKNDPVKLFILLPNGTAKRVEALAFDALYAYAYNEYDNGAVG